MRPTVLAIMLFFVLGVSSTLSAHETEIPLSVALSPMSTNPIGIGDVPLDDSSNSGNIPTSPTNFYAGYSGNVLTVLGPSGVTATVVVRDSHLSTIINTQFSGSYTAAIPTTGLHYITITCQHLTLTGQWVGTNTNIFASTLRWDIQRHQFCYVIHIAFPSFEMADSILIDPNTLEETYYNYVVYSEEEANDDLRYYQEGGNPHLPFLPVNLYLPENAAFDTTCESIEYYNSVELAHPYLPSQNLLEGTVNEYVQMNTSGYLTGFGGDWNAPVVVSEPYNYMGVAGVNLQFKPLIYDPIQNTILPIRSLTFRVCLADSSFYAWNDSILPSAGRDAINYFDNYRPIRSSVAEEKGNYLIITSTEYATEASTYADHKADIGYNTTVAAFTPATCTRDNIRGYLLEQYESGDDRPRYVLIIGDGSVIPYSDNTIEYLDGSPYTCYTDMYYACLDSPTVAQETLLVPDVFVGRWPISTHDELADIMEKCVDYEDETILNDRRLVLFSGTGNGAKDFAQVNDEVHTMVQNHVSYLVSVLYDGRDGYDDVDMRDELTNEDDWMLVYRGHGNSTYLGTPYTSIQSGNLPTDLPYFSLCFADWLNVPDGLGESWVVNGNRSCTFYGATIPTYRGDNNVLEKTVFNGLKDHVNYTIGEWLYRGIGNYVTSGGSKLEVRSYILYGDPSLYIYGMNGFGNPAVYISGRQAHRGMTEEELANEDITAYSVYTLQGTLVQTGYNGLQNTELLSLPQGVYIIRVTGGETQEMMRKIVVK